MQIMIIYSTHLKLAIYKQHSATLKAINENNKTVTCVQYDGICNEIEETKISCTPVILIEKPDIS